MGEFTTATKVKGRFLNPWMPEENLNLEKCRKDAKNFGSFDVPSKLKLNAVPEMKVVNIIQKILSNPPELGVQTTWLGHSTVLFQFDGINVLTDPVFSKSVGGMTRYRDAPCLPPDLPDIDVVVISHDHFDHLDMNSITTLNNTFPNRITWLVPSGVKSILPKNCKKVYELQWWDEHVYRKEAGNRTIAQVGNGVSPNINTDADAKATEFVFSLVPAQHCSQRKSADANTRLWGGWAMVGRRSRVYFCGDTGYCDVFKEIGDRYGPFDIAAIPIGGYKPTEVMQHLFCTPDDAVKIHKDVKAKRSIAVHWGTFMVGCERFLDPLKRLTAAVDQADIGDETFVCLRHGETRVFGGQYDSITALNNENFYSRSKNQSSKLYNYDSVGTVPPVITRENYESKSRMCVIL